MGKSKTVKRRVFKLANRICSPPIMANDWELLTGEASIGALRAKVGWTTNRYGRIQYDARALHGTCIGTTPANARLLRLRRVYRDLNHARETLKRASIEYAEILKAILPELGLKESEALAQADALVAAGVEAEIDRERGDDAIEN